MRFNEYVLIVLYYRCSHTDHESRDVREMANAVRKLCANISRLQTWNAFKTIRIILSTDLLNVNDKVYNNVSAIKIKSHKIVAVFPFLSASTRLGALLKMYTGN